MTLGSWSRKSASMKDVHWDNAVLEILMMVFLFVMTEYITCCLIYVINWVLTKIGVIYMQKPAKF